MSNWIVITKADLYNSAAASYVDSADSQQLGAGQTSRSAAVIADVVLEIRSAVARNGVVDVNAAAIPFGLKNLAVDTVILRLKKGLGIALDKDEVDALVRYDRKLEKIMSGELTVEAPDNPIAAQVTQGVAKPSFPQRGLSAPARQFNDTTQDG